MTSLISFLIKNTPCLTQRTGEKQQKTQSYTGTGWSRPDVKWRLILLLISPGLSDAFRRRKVGDLAAESVSPDRTDEAGVFSRK